MATKTPPAVQDQKLAYLISVDRLIEAAEKARAERDRLRKMLDVPTTRRKVAIR